MAPPDPWPTLGVVRGAKCVICRASIRNSPIGAEAHSTNAQGAPGWHGWAYGGEPHPVTTVAAMRLTPAGRLTPASAVDYEVAPHLPAEPPAAVRFVLGDRNDNTAGVRGACRAAEPVLFTSRYGRYPHTDEGVEVRPVFHRLRSASMENFDGQRKGLFDVHGPGPASSPT